MNQGEVCNAPIHVRMYLLTYYTNTYMSVFGGMNFFIFYRRNATEYG